MSKILKAFSLVEILIAMAIVGVLVAVLSPNLAKSLPDKKKALFVKAYTRTEQAVANMRSHPEMYVDVFNPEDIGKSGGSYTRYGLSNTEYPLGFLGAQCLADESEGGCKANGHGNTKFAYFFSKEVSGVFDSGDDGVTVKTSDGIIYAISGYSSISVKAYNKATEKIELLGTISIANDGKVSCGDNACSDYMDDRFDLKQKNE